MKSIMKWLAGIFLACSLILSSLLSSLWILQARLKPTNGFSKSSTS